MSDTTSTATPLPPQSSSKSTTLTAVPTKGSNKLYDVPHLEENGNNFAFWKFRVELVMQLRNLWPLVDGTDKAPTDITSSDYADWAYRDREARAQIALTLSDEPLNTVFQA